MRKIPIFDADEFIIDSSRRRVVFTKDGGRIGCVFPYDFCRKVIRRHYWKLAKQNLKMVLKLTFQKSALEECLEREKCLHASCENCGAEMGGVK